MKADHSKRPSFPKGEVMGALSFGDAANPGRLTEHHLVQGVILVLQIAQATENSDLCAQLASRSGIGW